MEHLEKGATGMFAKKTIFFFLKGSPYLMAKIIISERRCNLGDGEGLQVLCKLKFVGQCKCVDLL